MTKPPKLPKPVRSRSLLTDDVRAALKQLPVAVALERLDLAFKLRPRSKPSHQIIARIFAQRASC